MSPGDEYKPKETFNCFCLKVFILISCSLAVLYEQDESCKVIYV